MKTIEHLSYSLSSGVLPGMAVTIGAYSGGGECFFGSPVILGIVVGLSCSALIMVFLTADRFKNSSKSS
jgi:hypothetical protein